MTLASMYAASRIRLCDLVRSADDADLDATVPATPLWSVSDVIRHLAGVATDIGAGRFEGAATDPWTARQVEERAGRPVDEVLAEWTGAAGALEEAMEGFGGAATRLVIDVVTHEHDVRGALDRAGARDDESIDWSVQQLMTGVDRAVRKAGLPPVRIVAGTDEWLLGPAGDPVATLSIDRFELFRALMGRRSLVQLAGYEWTGDPAPYLGLLTVFPPAATDVVE